MKKLIFISVLTGTCVALFAFTLAKEWQIKEGYSIAFDNPDVYGVFRKFSGNIVFDEQDLENSVFDVKIDVSSINTGNGLRNESAKGADWFEVKKYPEITFSSTSIIKTEKGYQTTGLLRIRDVEEEITFPFTYENKDAEGLFKGSFSVNRLDYGLGSPEEEVDDIIDLEISVPVSRK